MVAQREGEREAVAVYKWGSEGAEDGGLSLTHKYLMRVCVTLLVDIVVFVFVARVPSQLRNAAYAYALLPPPPPRPSAFFFVIPFLGLTLKPSLLIIPMKKFHKFRNFKLFLIVSTRKILSLYFAIFTTV